MFDIGEKVTIISDLKQGSYDNCATTLEMIEMSGKKVTIKERLFNIAGRPRYYIKEDSSFVWSEPMFIPKESNNRYDWLDEII